MLDDHVVPEILMSSSSTPPDLCHCFWPLHVENRRSERFDSSHEFMENSSHMERSDGQERALDACAALDLERVDDALVVLVGAVDRVVAEVDAAA